MRVFPSPLDPTCADDRFRTQVHGSVGMRRVADVALGSSRRAFVESRSRSRIAMDRSMTYRCQLEP